VLSDGPVVDEGLGFRIDCDVIGRRLALRLDSGPQGIDGGIGIDLGL